MNCKNCCDYGCGSQGNDLENPCCEGYGIKVKEKDGGEQMRLIGAYEAIEQINEWLDQTGAIPLHTSYHFELLGCIEDCPTIDAVQVVRCGECQYRELAKVNCKGYTICPASGMEITDDDYCSYGEKKEGEK